jgi:hypothetical protein
MLLDRIKKGGIMEATQEQKELLARLKAEKERLLKAQDEKILKILHYEKVMTSLIQQNKALKEKSGKS